MTLDCLPKRKSRVHFSFSVPDFLRRVLMSWKTSSPQPLILPCEQNIIFTMPDYSTIWLTFI